MQYQSLQIASLHFKRKEVKQSQFENTLAPKTLRTNKLEAQNSHKTTST